MVIGIKRLGNNDFVFRVHDASKGKQQRLGTTRGYHDVFKSDFYVLFDVKLGQFFSVTFVTCRRTVFDNVQINIFYRFDGNFRAFYIGLSDV